MDASQAIPDPDVNFGLEYWTNQSADYDGVLGGFGTGSLPRVDALTSRKLLLHLLPELCTVPSTSQPLDLPRATRRTRALDVGAGVGRVTSDVLLHIFDDVLLLEPVDPLVRAALARGTASEGAGGEEESAQEKEGYRVRWKGIKERTKSVTFVQSTLQAFAPAKADPAKILGRVGYKPATASSSAHAYEDLDSGFDVVWCQWCLGHLSDAELIAFLQRAQGALRQRDTKAGESPAFMVVKENLCLNLGEGEGDEGPIRPRTVYDEQDSSLTRSDLAWKAIFQSAGLNILHEEVQHGFPDGLYEVKTYALRPLA